MRCWTSMCFPSVANVDQCHCRWTSSTQLSSACTECKMEIHLLLQRGHLVFYKLPEGTLCPIIQIFTEDFQQDWTKHYHMGVYCWFLASKETFTTDHRPLGLAIEAVLNPPHTQPIHTIHSFNEPSSPGHHRPSLWQGLAAGSHSTWCPSECPGLS